ncbi:MAG: hypothetical protein IJH34_05915 [Romboutsia sp.]|nr:hypothetical protein [Romboutsia sp.]
MRRINTLLSEASLSEVYHLGTKLIDYYIRRTTENKLKTKFDFDPIVHLSDEEIEYATKRQEAFLEKSEPIAENHLNPNNPIKHILIIYQGKVVHGFFDIVNEEQAIIAAQDYVLEKLHAGEIRYIYAKDCISIGSSYECSIAI